MKKILFICALVLVSSVAIVAQNNMRERMKERTEKYIKDLKLDDKKAADFRKLYDDSSERMQKEMSTMRESGNQDRETMRSKMSKFSEERDAEIKKILTDDEFKRYQDILSKEPRRGPENR